MKVLGSLLVSFLVICGALHAQMYWTPPAPISDSVSDNRNVCCGHITCVDIMKSPTIFVWEHSLDSTSTALYGAYYDFSGNIGTPFVVLAQPGVHYTKPVLQNFKSDGLISNLAPTDTVFQLFYNSDQNGNLDIYYLFVTADSLFHGPFPLAVSQDEETNLSADENLLTWSSGQKIIAATYWQGVLSNISILDSLDVHDPVIIRQLYIVAWIKENADSNNIYYSQLSSDSWSPPAFLPYPGNKYNLRFTDRDALSWQYKSGGTMGYSLHSFWPSALLPSFSAQTLDTLNSLSAFIMFDPWSGSNYWMLVNSVNFNENFDIYESSASPGSPLNLTPITSFVGDDINPRVFPFPGFAVYHSRWILTWESFHNGHWQLFTKWFGITGGIDDENANNETISARIYPNPFNEKVTIEVSSEIPASINFEISDLMGRSLYKHADQNSGNGNTTFLWDGHDVNGNLLPVGIYFLKIVSGDRVRTLKIIKNP